MPASKRLVQVATAPVRRADERDPSDQIQRDLESFGLSGHEAKVLLALIRAGSASASQLARSADVHRTSVYPLLQQLGAKGLAEALPGRSGLWASPGLDEVLDRLYGLEEQRLHTLRQRADSLREALADAAVGTGADAPPPFLHFVRGAGRVRRAYENLVASCQSELLVFNRPPYSYEPGEVNKVVMTALRRGVRSRVLYEAAAWEEPGMEGFRHAMARYHDAGVVGRLVDELPLKLAIADRSAALLALAEHVQPDVGFPINLLVEHHGFAALHARSFESFWAEAEPLKTP